MKISFDAVDKSGMTLDELSKFVEQAKANGVAGTEVISATCTIKGKLKHLEAKA